MEATYNIVAGDGKEYGPITLTQLQQWIDEGRVTPEMQLFRSDQTVWKNAEQFGELRWEEPGAAPTLPPPLPEMPVTPTPTVSTAVAEAKKAEIRANPFNDAHRNLDPELTQRIDRSARWFYWIAGLTAVNTVLTVTDVGLNFVVGLGLTRFLERSSEFRHLDQMTRLAPNIAAIVVFGLFGYLGRKGQTWSFVVGMILYALDTGLGIVTEDWLSVGFHLLAIYYIFLGLIASQKRSLLT